MDDINPATPSEFGRWLATARVDRDMTLRELHEVSGVSVRAIHNIESGATQKPSALIMRRLSRALSTGETTATQVPDGIAQGASATVFTLPEDPVDAVQLLTRLLQEQAAKMREG